MTTTAEKFATGFTVVIGPLTALGKYCHLPWREVLEAAERGDDGLTISNERDISPWSLDTGTFALREIIDPRVALRGYPSLWAQS